MGAKLAEWTEERIKALREYAELRLSSREIAIQLGGTSRSAVIGKMHRLGIEFRAASGFQRDPKKRSLRPRKSRIYSTQWAGTSERSAPKRLNVELSSVEPKHIGLVDLQSGMCRWPYGEGPYTFCGCVASGSYCDAHYFQAIRGTFRALEAA